MTSNRLSGDYAAVGTGARRSRRARASSARRSCGAALERCIAAADAAAPRCSRWQPTRRAHSPVCRVRAGAVHGPASSSTSPGRGRDGRASPAAPPRDRAPRCRRGYGGASRPPAAARRDRGTGSRRRTSSSISPIESCSTRNSSLCVAVAIARWNSRSMQDARLEVGALVVQPRRSCRRSGRCPPASRAARRARGGDLEHPPHLVHLAVVHLLPWTKWRIDSRTVLGVDRDDAHAAAAPHLEQALGRERAHGLADDRAGDPELGAQLALGRQRIARLQLDRRRSSRGSRR